MARRTVRRHPAAPAEIASREQDYWHQSRRPLLSLLVLAPLLLFYEPAALLLGADTLTARSLLQVLVGALGWKARLLPGAIVVIVLLLWHLVRRDTGKVRPGHVGWMFLESLAWAPPLLLVHAVVSKYAPPAALTAQTAGGTEDLLARVVLSIGAGIYEELIFRLLLVGLATGMLVRCGMRREAAGVLTVLVSAALFSWMHFWGAERFTVYAFAWRAAAGVYLGCLFCFRGFGITAMAHAAFDVIVSLMQSLRGG